MRVPHVVTVEIDTCLPTKSIVSLFDLVCSIWLSKPEGETSRDPSSTVAMQQRETGAAEVFPARSRNCHGSQTGDHEDPSPLAHKGPPKKMPHVPILKIDSGLATNLSRWVEVGWAALTLGTKISDSRWGKFEWMHFWDVWAVRVGN